MLIQDTPIKDLIVLTPIVHGDERGYFFESYNKKIFAKNNLDIEFVQDNESYSKYGTIRGLHFQEGEHAQSKLVRVVQGKILDVAVDLRPSSSTFGKHYAVELSAENKKQLFVPQDFAHGFVVLSTDAVVQYKCDRYYNKDAENGLRFDDPALDIDWQVSREKLIINQRDLSFKSFEEFKQNYRSASN